MIVVWLFLTIPQVCLQFVIVLFPDHTHLLFYIKSREPGVLFISLFTHCFTLQTSDYDVIFDFCVNSASLATSFKSATSS